MGEIRERFLVDHNGKTAVVIAVDDYKRLMEDLHDLTIAVER